MGTVLKFQLYIVTYFTTLDVYLIQQKLVTQFLTINVGCPIWINSKTYIFIFFYRQLIDCLQY